MMATITSLTPAGMTVYWLSIFAIGYLVGYWHSSKTELARQQRQRYELRKCKHRGEGTYVPEFKRYIFINNDAVDCSICELSKGGDA